LTGKKIACIGFGPFLQNDFSSFLRNNDIVVVEGGAEDEWVVLGRDGWTKNEVDTLIDRHVGGPLRVYSQEMLLSYLAADDDPFYGGHFVLEAFRAGHPGLEFVSEGWSGWVQAWVRDDRRQYVPGNMDQFNIEESPIHAMGYKVGITGESAERRRLILERAFRGPLPTTGPRTYMQQWGEPNSCDRLNKIAENIAACCRMFRNRRGCEIAVTEWETDLCWLKDAFYTHSHCQFQWPETFV
jgi:hypothetical protein